MEPFFVRYQHLFGLSIELHLAMNELLHWRLKPPND
jgi:hypothetical protein